MTQYYRGETIVDTFTILGADGLPATGVTVSADETIAPDGTSFSLTIDELGDGVYQVSFVAAQYGDYYFRLSTDTDPVQYFEEDYNVDITSMAIGPGGVSGVSSLYGNTLYDLIRAVAVRVGDFKQLRATASSPSTQWVDAVRLSAIPAGAYKGASLWTVGPNLTTLNFWEETRVKDSSEANKNLTLEPALPTGVTAGDIAWLTNLNSRGFDRQTYIDTINEAIQESFPNHSLPIAETLADRVDLSSPFFTLPTTFTHIYAVEAQGVDDAMPWYIPFSDQNIPGKSGWSWDYASSQLVLGGYAAQAAGGQLIRVLGYGREGILASPEDSTLLDRSYLVRQAAESLMLQTGDQKKLAIASMHGNDGDEYLVKAVTMFEPNTIRIR